MKKEKHENSFLCFFFLSLEKICLTGSYFHDYIFTTET